MVRFSTTNAIGRRARYLAARWCGSQAGVAAVEFALVLPVMVVMLLGMTDVTYGVNVDRKLTILSRSLADLSARISSISTTEMSNIFAAASAVMEPFDASSTQMVVSSVLVSKSGSTYTGTVDWSCGKNIPSGGTGNLKPRVKGTTYTVPSGFTSASSFILVETQMPYKPIFGYVITGTIKLGETTPWPVRNVSQVTGPSSCPT